MRPEDTACNCGKVRSYNQPSVNIVRQKSWILVILDFRYLTINSINKPSINVNDIPFRVTSKALCCRANLLAYQYISALHILSCNWIELVK